MESNEVINAAAKKPKEWGKLIGTIGLGALLSIIIVPRLLNSNESNQKFIQDEFLDAIKEESAASAKVASSLDNFRQSVDNNTKVWDKVEDALKDFKTCGDNTQKRIDKLIEIVYKEYRAELKRIDAEMNNADSVLPAQPAPDSN